MHLILNKVPYFFVFFCDISHIFNIYFILRSFYEQIFYLESLFMLAIIGNKS